MSADLLAEQITLLDAQHLNTLPLRDFALYAFSKKHAMSPALEAVVLHYNNMCAWAAHVVVSAGSEKQRLIEMKRMIQVADKLHAHCNFHGASAIMCGLTNTAVTRLKKLRNHLPSKYTSRYTKLQQFYSPLQNYGTYRSSLATVETLVPILSELLRLPLS